MDIDLTGGRGGAPPGPYGVPPPAPRPPRSPLRILLSLVGSVATLPVFVVLFAGAPSCMGFEEPTLRIIEACPPAAAALGTPVSRSWLGASCGSARESGAFGNASWTFPVSGPSGSGSVRVLAERRGGPWIVRSAMVETSAGAFEAVSCAGGAMAGRAAGLPSVVTSAPAAPPPIAPPVFAPPPGMAGAGGGVSGLLGGAPLHLAATVESVVGAAPAAMGEACDIDVLPAGLGAPCRVDVRCGGRPIYGGGAPHALCLPGSRGGTTVADVSSADGDPMLTVTSESGQATLTSMGASTWVLTLRFPPTP